MYYISADHTHSPRHPGAGVCAISGML